MTPSPSPPAMPAMPAMPAELLSKLLGRLRADGGRYLLSIALTREERDAEHEPTFGGKGHSRWLTEAEHTALCAALDAALEAAENASPTKSEVARDE